MKNLTIDTRNYWLPESVDEVINLVNMAIQSNRKIAVRGAAHSFPLIRTNEEEADYIFIMLSYLDEILSFDQSKGVVKVQAGCHIGIDPFDPTMRSNVKNSLVYQLDPFDIKEGKRIQKPGWALPDLGGITHQTIGGFLATGSAGGATQYSLEDAILSVDIVCADIHGAKLETFNRPTGDEDDPFYGVAFANLGLMGILVSVTFQCIPSYNISGSEQAYKYEESCPVDLFDSGSNSIPDLKHFFYQPQYTRLLWWPQSTVKKMVIWKAERVDAFQNWETYKSKPYREVPYIFGGPKIASLAADAIFSFVGKWPSWLEKLFGDEPKTRASIQKFVDGLNPKMLKYILDIFEPVSIDHPKSQDFHDVWWNGLPMDNQMSDKLFPVWFTELWIPIELTAQVMSDLKSFYENVDHAGTFSCEIYATGKNRFWLSPGYNTDVIRIDVFWFGHNSGDPREYYSYFWSELSKYGFRPHWGKYLPNADGDQGVSYLEKVYPDTWTKWMTLRSEMDPKNVFLTDYWANHLGIDN